MQGVSRWRIVPIQAAAPNNGMLLQESVPRGMDLAKTDEQRAIFKVILG
jgi:hypothetical protein